MSDFGNTADFRKGKLATLPYQDPTYLSFVLMFDFTDKVNSPLLAGGATAYYDKLISQGGGKFYEERKEDLQNFIQALKTINNRAPWYWQGLGGLDRILKYDTGNPFRGGDEAVLTISTLESINLAITGLMQLYRRAAFDENKWGWILPKNLRQFRMYVYVTEIRAVRNYDEGGVSLIAGAKPVAPLTGEENKPYLMVSLGSCEFDIQGGTTPFADLSKNPDAPVGNEIGIKYDIVNRVEARALNGIVNTTYNDDKISPAPPIELENSKGKLKSKIQEGVENIAKGLANDMKRLSKEKQLEIEQYVRDRTLNKIQNPENVFKNFINKIDQQTDINQQTRNLGVAVQENVYGFEASAAIRRNLDDAAVRSLGNVYG
jgi:hypothetical protein